MIDLRSDTVTKPTAAMLEAMAKADVGDDVYGEDPTVNRLQEKCAELFGKEGALFVVSGSMGNLVSLLSHCGRGDEIIVGKCNHIFQWEQGGAASLGGIHTQTIDNSKDGSLPLEEIEGAIRFDDQHCPVSRLVCIENTQDGRVLPVEYMNSAGALCRKNNLLMHVDGARIFNAAIALKVPVKTLVASADSLQMCFSKGLSAPVGSIVTGSKEFIKKAHRARKLVGGGMRQAGVLAAACIVALDTMVERLHEDHANAQLLADGLKNISDIDVEPVHSNMVFFKLKTGDVSKLSKTLKENGLLANTIDRHRMRMVTHYGIEKSDIETAIGIVNKSMKQAAKV
ncbi:MAG: low-specificity L-threonine aldolase [Cyanobacteria bacterium PR.3.49]|jgi:threonine aldolase|nr:low-specificity L-threonine aldolase [Cyanobacteria bacterium PR.3.49]